MKTYVWIVGARGLLGSAISAAVAERSNWTAVDCEPLPWSGSDEALADAARVCTDQLLAAAGGPATRWTVIWAAGAAVTSTPESALANELRQFSLVLDVIGEEARSRSATKNGAVFYSSSAGGVYGGSADPPFDEYTVPVPISRYGRFKLDAEERLFHFSDSSGVSAVAGRIANLYGPGQKLSKMQGLVSHLAKAQYSPAPASIFVPLDTVRDYIFVRDCAELVLDTLDRLLVIAASQGRSRVVKNIASGHAVTIGNLLGQFRVLAKGHPHVMLASSPESSHQGLDLRIRSSIWPDLDHRDLTPLPVGINATMDDVLGHIQAGDNLL